jgi:hypothetical protein
VLNEFLHGVSKGFADAAFASFSRRRSTVREDINQSFGGGDEAPAAAAAPAYDAPSSVGSEPSASDTKAIAAPKRGRKGGVVDAGKGKRGRKAGASAPRKTADVGLSEV